MIPNFIFYPYKYKARDETCYKRDAKVNKYAFGYLTDAYNLIALPIGGHDSEQEPTQQDIASVIDIVKENDIRYVYAESLNPSDAVLTIIAETGAELEILSPLEGLTAAQIMSGEDYFSVMKDNLIAIAKGFI